MAAINFGDMGESPNGCALAAAMNWAGAFLSVLLIAGLATWGWKLWVRDVTGVPVVRALEGPMRVMPDDPGGQASAYQGLAVNSIAEERVEALADRVVLAPAPTSLNEDEDLPMAELAPVAEAQPLVASEILPVIEPELESTVTTAFVEEAETKLEAVPSATDLAVAAALADVVDLVAIPASFVVNAGPGVPVTTPRPLGRPAEFRVASLSLVKNDVTGDIVPAKIPPGTRLVQLGAFGSPEVARTNWANAMAQFGDYMVGKERVIQQAETGGRTFWRLRATGFETLADARRFCAVLVSDGANCIPVTQE